MNPYNLEYQVKLKHFHKLPCQDLNLQDLVLGSHLNLLLAIEQEFQVSLNDEEVAQLNSFEIVLEMVESKLGGASNA